MPRYGVSALNLQSDELKKNQYKTLKVKVSNMQDTHWGFKIQPDNISLHLRQRHFFFKNCCVCTIEGLCPAQLAYES